LHSDSSNVSLCLHVHKTRHENSGVNGSPISSSIMVSRRYLVITIFFSLPKLRSNSDAGCQISQFTWNIHVLARSLEEPIRPLNIVWHGTVSLCKPIYIFQQVLQPLTYLALQLLRYAVRSINLAEPDKTMYCNPSLTTQIRLKIASNFINF
jgi:hypothetical protein